MFLERIFQSTLPVRGATIDQLLTAWARLRFQSTLPVRGATGRKMANEKAPTISIHAPRAGSDENQAAQLLSNARISIHAPRAGSDARVC